MYLAASLYSPALSTVSKLARSDRHPRRIPIYFRSNRHCSAAQSHWTRYNWSGKFPSRRIRIRL